MTEIEKLKEDNQGLEFDGVALWLYTSDGNVELISDNAFELIEEYYEGEEVCDNPNDDPEKHTYSKVSGVDFIKYNFDSDYQLAFKKI